MPLVKSHQIDFDLVELSDVRENGNGGKTVYVNYKRGLFKIQTPKLTLPYNMSVYDKGEYPKYSLGIDFRDMEEDHRVRGFYENMETLQELIVNSCFKNCKKWLGKTLKTVDVTQAMFTPIIKKYRDQETGEENGKYPDSMRLKLPVRDGKVGFTVVDFDDNEIENPDLATLLTKDSKIQAILRCGGIWLIAGKFGCTWTVEKLRVESSGSVEGGSGGMNFIDDDDDSQDEDDSGEEESDDDSDEE